MISLSPSRTTPSRYRRATSTTAIGAFIIFLLSLLAIISSNNYLTSTITFVDNNSYSATASLASRKNERTIDLTIPKPQTTLVHYDPRFIGGFRNQHMRFVAFVNYAVKNNISQILLPSLHWGEVVNPGKSIMHEYLFDVPYWNERAEEKGLPRLVRYDPSVLEGVVTTNASDGNDQYANVPCWNTTSNLYSGLDEQFLRSPMTNLRKVTTWAQMGNGIYSHCRGELVKKNSNYKPKEGEDSNSNIRRFTRLEPHGGLQGTGRLWWEYEELQRHRKKATDAITIGNRTHNVYPEHVPLEKSIFQLLRPSKPIRLATEKAIEEAIQQTSNSRTAAATKNHSLTERPRLLALHPRVEQGMLTHMCGEYMESNLTTIFERLRTYPNFLESSTSNTNATSKNNDNKQFNFDLVFIALSRANVEKKPAIHILPHLVNIMEQNLQAFNHARNYGLFGSDVRHESNDFKTRSVPIFESGEATARMVSFPPIQTSSNQPTNHLPFHSAESFGVVELVASIINFFTLVKADIFVGVRGSTFSTDAFSIRYYLSQEKADGMGRAANYIVGPDGIDELIGPPEALPCM